MSKVAIDTIDRIILEHLMKNARMPFLEIARECGISGAAIHQRVKKLDEAGVILGSSFEVDRKKLGFDICAIVGIKISDTTMNYETVKRLKDVREIVECHFITGKYNILIKMYCPNNERLMRTLFDKVLSIPWISDTETFISLDEVFSREIDVALILDED